MDSAWVEYRRRTRVFWLALLLPPLAMVPSTALSHFLVTRGFNGEMISLLAIALPIMGIIVMAHLRRMFWACPRCGRPFHVTWWFGKRVRAAVRPLRPTEMVANPKAGADRLRLIPTLFRPIYASLLTHRKPRRRPRASGGRPRRYELRQSDAGPIQLPPRSHRTFPGTTFRGFRNDASGRP